MPDIDNKITDFLKRLTKKSFNQGDNYYAYLNSKKTAWLFGYTNDYPMQHGNGEENRISPALAKYLYEKLGKGEKV